MTLNSLAIVLSILLMLLLAAAYSMPTNEQQRTGENKVTHKEATDLESSLNFSTLEVARLSTELAGLSIHSYLKELYSNLTYSDRLLLSNEEMEVSTVQSYKNQLQLKDSACGYYRFDVHEDANDGEQMIQAELRLLQKNSPTLAGDYNVDIYYMLSESHWSPLPISFKHIDSTPGWKTFDITPIVINWKQGLVNHGIQLRLTKGKEILSCEGVFSEGEEDPMSTEPLLIVYANDDSMPTNSLKKRDVTPQQQKTIRSPIDVQNGYCHRKEMVVKADSLRSDGVRVLFPQAFDIGVCDGHCSYREGYPSDYALIFYLHHYNTEGSGIPSRCCVPTSFRKETLLYERRGVYTIKHAGFIVDKCTCL